MTGSPALDRPRRTIPELMAVQIRAAVAADPEAVPARVLIEHDWHPDSIAAHLAEAERLAGAPISNREP